MKKSTIIKWLEILSESCTISENDFDEDYTFDSCSSCALAEECNKICPKSVTPQGMLNVINKIEELEGDNNECYNKR